MSHGLPTSPDLTLVDSTDPTRKAAVDGEGRVLTTNTELVAAVRDLTAAILDLRAFMGRINPNVF